MQGVISEAPAGDRAPLAADQQPQLRRVLELAPLTAGSVGMIIGAGVYVLIGTATERAGASVWAAFLLSALLCAFTGLNYGELTSLSPAQARSTSTPATPSRSGW